jgi:transcriptional regulator with XRE-family HTH domain
MRVRTYLRQIRLAAAPAVAGHRGLSIGEVALYTGLAKGEISSFERGHAIPRDDQLEAMKLVYGDPSTWYPATVARALLPDLADCPGCGDELDPDASGARRYHNEECRAAARHVQPPAVV